MKQLACLSLFLILLLMFSCNHAAITEINDQGVNISYTDTGNGDTTLLFVHGWCINKGYWSNQVPILTKNIE